VGGAASRASAAPTADAVVQHSQPAVGAAPTATAAGLHLPEDGGATGVHLPPRDLKLLPQDLHHANITTSDNKFVLLPPCSNDVEFYYALGISTQYFYVWIMCELDLKTLAMSYVARAAVCLLSYAVECLFVVCLCAAMIQTLNLH
jgi:hypothetical protein